MPPFIDLHIHTLASDGRDSPAEVVRKAAALGLCAIAITDHDTLEGLEEAENEGKKLGIEVIRGCELSIASEHGEVHILALWLPQEAETLEKALEQLRQNRAKRNEIIVEKLNAMGVDINYEDVLRATRSPDNATAKNTKTKKATRTQESTKKEFSTPPNTPNAVGRPHIATVLLEKGYVSSIREAFSKYLGTNSPAFEAKKLLDVEEIMQLLVQHKATISLAHAGLIPCERVWLESYIQYLQKLGLNALEVYHSEHDTETTEFLLKLAHKYDLGITGGSDYHGSVKPHISLGCGRGNLRIGVDILDALKERQQK